jgi:hypothetical protein
MWLICYRIQVSNSYEWGVCFGLQAEPGGETPDRETGQHYCWLEDRDLALRHGEALQIAGATGHYYYRDIPSSVCHRVTPAAPYNTPFPWWMELARPNLPGEWEAAVVVASFIGNRRGQGKWQT